MKILKPSFTLTADQEQQFYIRIFTDNMKRSKLFAKIVIIFEAILLSIQLVTRAVADIYTVMYLFLLFLAIGMYLITKSFEKQTTLTQHQQRRYEVALHLFVSIFVTWGAVVTLIDQAVYGHLMAFIVNVMCVSILFHASNKLILKIYTVPVLVIGIGLPFFQPSYNVVMGHYVNLAVFMFFSWIASRMLYINHLENFYSRQLLEEMNANLSSKIKENERINKELEQVNEQLKHLAILDELTKIPNRRGFQEFTYQLFKTSNKRFVSIVMLDIDAFKMYNDFYGHPEGDKVIKKVAQVINTYIKSENIIGARYGGEEFIIGAFDYTIEEIYRIAEAIRQDVENEQMVHAFSEVSSFVTISLGLASKHLVDEDDLEQLIELADQALYSAKQQGKNRVYQYEDKVKPI